MGAQRAHPQQTGCSPKLKRLLRFNVKLLLAKILRRLCRAACFNGKRLERRSCSPTLATRDKDVARMGHPDFCGEERAWETGGGRLRFVLSHAFYDEAVERMGYARYCQGKDGKADGAGQPPLTLWLTVGDRSVCPRFPSVHGFPGFQVSVPVSPGVFRRVLLKFPG